MQQTKAVRKIEDWLKVPVDYESVLPALQALRSTSYFNEYLNRIAACEYKSTDEVLADLNQYEEEATKKAAARHVLEDKLSALSGKKQTLKSESQTDILDLIERTKRDKTDAETKEEQLNRGYEAFVQRYENRAERRLNSAQPSQTSALVPQCPRCSCAMQTTQENAPLSASRILLVVLLFFIFMPACILPLFIDRKKITVSRCPRCSHTSHI